MATIGELIINLNASTAAFVTELNRVKNLSFDTATQIQRSFSLIGTAAIGMLGTFTVSLGAMVDKTTELETHILHLAESSGVTVATMSGLSFVASMFGMQVDQIALAMERFDKNLLLIQSGSGGTSALKEVFAGIDPAAIKQSDDALKLIADRFAAMPDGALKSAEALTLFGRAGGAMIPILDLGSAGLQKYMDMAKELGLVFSKDDAEAALQFQQNLTVLHAEFTGFEIELEKTLLPNLNALTDVFIEQSKQVTGSATLIDILKFSFQSIATVIIVTIEAAKLFGSEMQALGAVFQLDVDGMVDALAALELAATGHFAAAKRAMADYADTTAAKTQVMADTAARNLQIGIQANQQMDAVWGSGTAAIGAQQKALDALTVSAAAHQKAVDALEKSTEGMVSALDLQIKTMGMTNQQATDYKLTLEAQKLGIDAWMQSEIQVLDTLAKKKVLLDQLHTLDNNEIAAEKLRFTQDQVKADQDDLATMQAALDVTMRMANVPQPLHLDPHVNDAFTASIKDQTDALEHEIATFGMSSEAIARYDLAQLDSSDAAQKQVANFKVLQDQMSAMNVRATQLAGAWKTFGEVANRSLDDLIFSGKSFTQVLADITKQLGEMFLKWALFGFGGQGAGSGGGLFGALMSGLSGLFGGVSGGIPTDMFQAFPLAGLGLPAFAGGGSVSSGQPIMVGENGPEIFKPSTSGAIIPAGASVGPQINITYQIDARGSSITEAQFQASLAASESRAVQRSLNMVKEVQARTA